MNAANQAALVATVVAVFVLAGFVKGVVGMGLPTVAVGLLALFVPLPDAMALLILPSLVTNLWQALAGPPPAAVLGRIWPLLLGICVGTAAAGALGLRAGAQANLLLGTALVAYALLGLGKWQLHIGHHLEDWLSPLAGAATGAITVATGVFVVPAVPFLQGLGLGRDALVQALGWSFSVSTIALALVLADHGVFSAGLAFLSIAALVPAIIGMALGQWARAHLPAAGFRLLFLVGLLLLGVYLGLPPLLA